jgi:hypothetical protein
MPIARVFSQPASHASRGDSLSLVLRSRPTSIKPMRMTRDRLIEPVFGDLSRSIAKIKTVPEI